MQELDENEILVHVINYLVAFPMQLRKNFN